ncbi:hypothetical protein PanWU01x14_043190 [Parasponia andersonii]|uniref:Uncharacterized protein n=1 Tax=Parasponia andersonii TaxID=3476 RepID=A0A2P5DPX6_PARAD|nr:hypothetical protein PanWU01x14_043190 [Parasponia andersonii]
MVPRTAAIISPPTQVTRIAAHWCFCPTTIYEEAMKATEVHTEASHINLLITTTTLFSAFVSPLTSVIWTTTTAKEVKSATALKMKKILKGGLFTTTAVPSSLSPPGTVKIAAKATVAKSTATTVTELVAL